MISFSKNGKRKHKFPNSWLNLVISPTVNRSIKQPFTWIKQQKNQGICIFHLFSQPFLLQVLRHSTLTYRVSSPPKNGRCGGRKVCTTRSFNLGKQVRKAGGSWRPGRFVRWTFFPVKDPPTDPKDHRRYSINEAYPVNGIFT